jgi:hypothetical protein
VSDGTPATAPAEPSREHRGEARVALVVFALPLAYLATQRTPEVDLWRFSYAWLAGTLAYAAGYALLRASYRRRLPAALATLRKLAVATAASLVVALCGLEVLLHATDDAAFEPRDNSGRHLFDADVGHVYLPNFEQTIQTREFTTHWRSNAQGLRAERDFGPKPAGVARVVVVGDSFTVGDQVPYGETYPAVMQAEFDRLLGPGRVEVLNAGFPGFGTVHERKWIEKFACALEPDLVVVGSTPNDLVENRFPILYAARDGELFDPRVPEGARLAQQDHARWWSVPGWVERSKVVARANALGLVDRLRGRRGSAHRRAFQIRQDADSVQQYALYEQEILLARDAAASCGAKFAVLAIPFLEQLRVPGKNQDFALWGARLAEIGARGNFPVIDLLPAFRAGGDPAALYWREDSHCRAAGYRLIGVGASASLAGLGSAVGLPAGERRDR